MEPLTHLKSHMKFTRPFKQSHIHNYESSADIRLRILAMASGKLYVIGNAQFINLNFIIGSWQIDEKNQPVPSPGQHFGLCPGGILIHDIQHNLLLFQPISAECRQEGRLLSRITHLSIKNSLLYFDIENAVK